jgi:hypothetical protein
MSFIQVSVSNTNSDSIEAAVAGLSLDEIVAKTEQLNTFHHYLTFIKIQMAHKMTSMANPSTYLSPS